MADSIQLRARGEQKIGLYQVVAPNFLRYVIEPPFFFWFSLVTNRPWRKPIYTAKTCDFTDLAPRFFFGYSSRSRQGDFSGATPK